MSRRVKNYEEFVPLICSLPVETYYSVGTDNKLEVQAKNQMQVKAIRSKFPGTYWKKTFRKDLNWWEYDATVDKIKIRIYACAESPPNCKIVTEKQTVKERVAVKYEERWVEKDVVIGYDCGGGDTDIESRKETTEEIETEDSIEQ
jgi:hypothetical protein